MTTRRRTKEKTLDARFDFRIAWLLEKIDPGDFRVRLYHGDDLSAEIEWLDGEPVALWNVYSWLVPLAGALAESLKYEQTEAAKRTTYRRLEMLHDTSQLPLTYQSLALEIHRRNTLADESAEKTKGKAERVAEAA